MDRIVITGGAGFIGSHLCDHFVKEGFDVVCIDNFLTGRKKNIAHLQKSTNFTLHETDICLKTNLKGNIKYILHLASVASPIDYLKYPIETLKVGSIGTYNMIELAKKKGARLLFASTSEVYGDPEQHPQKESYWGNVNSIGKRSCYDESKRFSESLVMAYHRKYGIETRIIRIFNTYGPRMKYNDGRVVPTFCKQALLGEDLTVFGNGLQTRSFCYIDDLIKGILRALYSDYPLPINLGNPDEFKIIDFVEIIKELTGTDTTVVFKELPEDDPKVRRPDISLAKEILGWTPKIDLRTGLRKTLEYIKHDLTP